MNWKKLGMIVLGLGIVFGSCAVIGSFLFDKTIGETIEARKKEHVRDSSIGMVNDAKEAERRTINFLLLGVDERKDDDGRSDTIIIASVNFLTNKIGLISIPRDTLVDIPLHGQTKINHAYAYGGINLAKEVVEKTTGIKIHNYIIANFDAFRQIVDAFGGVEINVEKDMYYRDDYDGPHGFLIDLKAGKQILNGDKALQYARYRDDEGDIGRAKRQQTLLKELSTKIISANVIIEAPNLIRKISGAVKSDISFNNMVHLLRSVDPMKKYEVDSVLLPGHPEMIDELSYWVIDKDLSKSQLVALNDFVAAPDVLATSYKPQKPAETTKLTEETKKQEETHSSANKNMEPLPKNEKESRPILSAGGFLGESSLDWQIAQLDKENKEKREAQERLRQKEKEEQEEELRIRELQNITHSEKGITIINTTSDESKTERAILALADENLEVGMVSARGTGSPATKTIFIIGNDDKATIDALPNIPFRFTTLYRKNVDTPTLIIGDDF